MVNLAVTARYGNPNPDTVRSIETELNKHGAGIAIDGSFGPATLAAVKALHSRHGIAATGVVCHEACPVLNSAG